LDHFKLEQVDWLGASCAGYLAIRAAAFEPRIKHVIALPATYWGLGMTLKQATPGQDRRLSSLFMAGDRDGVEALVAVQRKVSTCFDWCITQGMHITGTHSPYAYLSGSGPFHSKEIWRFCPTEPCNAEPGQLNVSRLENSPALTDYRVRFEFSRCSESAPPHNIR
jgi:hypothetical protein